MPSVCKIFDLLVNPNITSELIFFAQIFVCFKFIDEKYIGKWISDGEISCDLETLFEWIITEYKLKKTNLTNKEKQIAEDIKKRFPIDQWRVIKIFSDHQKKYRYYKKAIEDVKNRTTPRMNEQAIMTIFSPGWGINT